MLIQACRKISFQAILQKPFFETNISAIFIGADARPGCIGKDRSFRFGPVPAIVTPNRNFIDKSRFEFILPMSVIQFRSVHIFCTAFRNYCTRNIIEDFIEKVRSWYQKITIHGCPCLVMPGLKKRGIIS